MAEILIKATDNSVVDPVEDREGCYKKGDPVVVMPDGHGWGRKEGLPAFVILKIPGVHVSAIKQYSSSWDFILDFEVVASNEEGFRIRMFAVNVSASLAGVLTKSKVESWLVAHGATVVRFGTNEVVFDLPLTDPDNIAEFKQAAKAKLDRLWTRRRYSFTSGAVNAIIANGGEMTTTKTEALSYLTDRLSL